MFISFCLIHALLMAFITSLFTLNTLFRNYCLLGFVLHGLYLFIYSLLFMAIRNTSIQTQGQYPYHNDFTHNMYPFSCKKISYNYTKKTKIRVFI